MWCGENEPATNFLCGVTLRKTDNVDLKMGSKIWTFFLEATKEKNRRTTKRLDFALHFRVRIVYVFRDAKKISCSGQPHAERILRWLQRDFTYFTKFWVG